ncbi:MAG: hypothetical protein JJU31_16235, partial [Wenzhouxiangella sp.]|nr:hypothetical protein [Wenzhouxiangella sp.]
RTLLEALNVIYIGAGLIVIAKESLGGKVGCGKKRGTEFGAPKCCPESSDKVYISRDRVLIEPVLDQAARDVLADNGGMLVATHGICNLDEPGRCQPVADFPAPAAEVLMLHRDTGGQVWAGTEEGLFRRDPAGHWLPSPLHWATVRTVLEEPSGRLLFGTNGQGILVREPGNGAAGPARQIGPEQGLSSPFVRALLALPDGLALVGTEDAGLCLLSRKLAVIRCISREGGLPHHSAHY